MAEAQASVPDPAFPSEPFPCPACGQMLAPTCRVCVACRQAIDPAEIKPLAEVPAVAPEPRGNQRTAPATVPFPWLIFLAFLLVRVVTAGFAEHRWGLVKAELVLGGFEMLCSAWVFFDANRNGVPKPLRWAFGTLLLWPIVFPWYLVRRKTPRALCPFVEGIGLPVVLLALLAVGVLIVLVKGPLK